jgi:hypothetical protein
MGSGLVEREGEIFLRTATSRQLKISFSKRTPVS